MIASSLEAIAFYLVLCRDEYVDHKLRPASKSVSL